MDLTTNETAARLRRAVTRMNRKLRRSSLGGVSPAQASMLASVAKLTSPSLGDLAIAEQIQPPSVTKLVKDLVRDGLVTTLADPVDRRSTHVELTPLGRKELGLIRQRKTEFLERKVQELSAADRRKAEELITFLETLLEGE